MGAVTTTDTTGVVATPNPAQSLLAEVWDYLGMNQLLAAQHRVLGRLTPESPPRTMAEIHTLICGTYRAVLEDAGWDVDLVPAPASSLIEVHADGFQTAASAPPGHPIHEELKLVPGARWDGMRKLWLFPTDDYYTACALLPLLDRPEMEVDPDVVASLNQRAASSPPAAVRLVDDKIAIRFQHTSALQDDVKRIPGASWDGTTGQWLIPLIGTSKAVEFASKHGLGVEPEVSALVAAREEPFDYDLTVDGLRGVPVSELVTVQSTPAVGKRGSLEERLADYGVHSVYDLLSVIPIRYLNRSQQTPIRDATVGDILGFLVRVTEVGQWNREKRLIRFTVGDKTGTIDITFFNMPWLARRFHVGDEVVVYGRLDVWQPNPSRRVLQMTNPIMDPVGNDTAMIVPVYPQSAKNEVTTWDIHSSAMEAIGRLGNLQDPIPEEMKTRLQLANRAEAFREIHRPTAVETAEQARDRLAFDELFRMQLALGMKRRSTNDEVGVTHAPSGAISNAFLAKLPYKPTGAQVRAMQQINADLKSPHPMSRLLQGDVGAGKTLVASLTLIAAVEGGFQGALMAPTEILASQLYRELAETLSDTTHTDGRLLVVEFLGGKTRAAEKRRILAGLADGSVDIVVGTHALIVDQVVFAKLGVVVIDEQHRFGVDQRSALREKGNGVVPDVLAMTATPIPRTAALTVFGDLDISVLDELPPNRTPILTAWIPNDLDLANPEVSPWREIREEVAQGRQAYVVASLVEDNEKIAAESALNALTELDSGALAGLRLGLVHGKLPREEREQTMADFKNGDLDVLVATTVIEVGVNVPNATIITILDASRFGIAQLHQIRGRVGRGAHASRCFLTGKAKTPDATRRMEALVESTDGFYLSEVDLELRGEGSLFGARQSGQTDLKVASLRADRELVVTCRNEANTILNADPTLGRRPGLRNEVIAALDEDTQKWLTKT